MKAKVFIIFILFLGGIYIVYRLNKTSCQSCVTSQIQIIEACAPVRSAYTSIYRRLNCFCDNSQNWEKLGALIHRLNYYGNIYGKKYPENIFGTKNISCHDDELQVDVFEDNEVFLYIEQDTSKAIYDGALKKVSIGNVRTDKIGILDVGNENRTVTKYTEKTTVKYNLNYEELNSQSLIKFQQAIHHDSTYQKNFKNVEYQLVNKESRKHEATIRYEDFGERFYLDIR